MPRTISKEAVALIISREPAQEGHEDYLDLQVLPAEEGDDDSYLLSVANLAANLLERSMFGEEEEEEDFSEDELGFDVDPEYFGNLFADENEDEDL